MHILLVSIFFKKTYGDIFLNVFIKFEEWLKIVKECSQTILIFIITMDNRNYVGKLGKLVNMFKLLVHS